MKKILITALALMMLLSLMCFALPAVVEVGNSEKEGAVDFAGLSEVEENGDIEHSFADYFSNYAPSIRTEGERGIRFKAGIATAAKYETESFVVEEYGFVIARQDHLEKAGAELTLDFPMIAKGVAYNKAENIDVVFDGTDDEICIFTGVLKGIPEKHYATNVVYKTYAKINVGGQTEVVYGEAVEENLYELAKKFIAEGSEDENLLNIVRDYEIAASVPDENGNLMAKGKFAVVSTPNYCFNFSSDSLEYLPLGKNADNGDMVLVAMDNDAPINSINVNLEDIDNSLADTSSDSLVMMEYELVYKYSVDNGENTFEGIVSAEMNGNSKGTTSDVKVNYVEPENEFDYYFDPVNRLYTDIPRADGSMEILGEKVYFFDAPYEYIRPDFSEDMSEFEKYHLMNANNLKLIDFKQLSDGTYCYYIDNTRPLSNADDLIVNLQRLFSNGIYYIEITDADGDGIYDYIQYMPATYGFMNGDTSVTFKEKMTGNEPIFEENEDADEYDITIVPTIYCNGADIEGEAVKDGDFVVAYLNPKANYMKIIEVVNPVTDTVHSYNKAQSKITFSENGDHYCSRGYRIVEGFSSGDSGLDQQYINRPFCYKHLFIVSVIFQDLLNVNIFNGDVTVYSVEVGGFKNILYYDAPAVVEQPEEPEIPEEPVVLEEPYNYRIISGYDIGEDSDGKWRFYYSIYDPFTGTISDDIPSVKSADKAKDLGNALACGTVVKITNDFLIDDAESEVLGNVDFSNLVWIKSMDEASMTVVPVDETAECKNCVEKYMEAYTGTNYKDFLGNEHQSNVVEITEDTVFTVMKRSSLNESFFVDAIISPITLSDVLENGKNVLCYNSMSEDRNYNYITTYADYKKALVLPDSNGEAVFVIIIVNDRDAAALNVACENCQ